MLQEYKELTMHFELRAGFDFAKSYAHLMHEEIPKGKIEKRYIGVSSKGIYYSHWLLSYFSRLRSTKNEMFSEF